MRLLSLIAPPLCVACRAALREGAWLCSRCGGEIVFLGENASLGGVSAWAPVAYEGPARAIVARLKFHGAVALADHMAAVIAANAPAGALALPLVPVASPASRRRRRGFCHAELLARSLGRRAGLPCLRLLSRVDDGRRQLGRARAERLGAPPRFRAARGDGDAVLLVDDVITTGATLAACARALEDAGWGCDRALAYARTPVR